MTLLQTLRARLAAGLWSDIVEVPLQCAISLDEAYNSLSYFIEDRARRLRRLLDR
jgi:hypothetical protein